MAVIKSLSARNQFGKKAGGALLLVFIREKAFFDFERSVYCGIISNDSKSRVALYRLVSCIGGSFTFLKTECSKHTGIVERQDPGKHIPLLLEREVDGI